MVFFRGGIYSSISSTVIPVTGTVVLNLPSINQSATGQGGNANSMFFLLDSTQPEYSNVVSAIAGASSLGTHMNNSNFVIYSSSVTSSQVDSGNSTLDPVKTANYPNSLCRHRWISQESFNFSGYHMLGSSENSVFGVTGRKAIFVRPQLEYDPTSNNYGLGNGLTHYDALRGMEDPQMNNGTNTTIQLGSDIFISEGPMYRWDDGDTTAGNNGLLYIMDPTGLGSNNTIRLLSDPDWPGMFWGQYRVWDRLSNLPFSVYDAGNSIYVCGGAQGTGYGTALSSTGSFLECTVDDFTLDATTLLKRHVLKSSNSITNLQGSNGYARMVTVTGSQGSDYSKKVFVWNETSNTFTDETGDAGAPPGTFTVCPIDAPNNTALYVLTVKRTNGVRIAPFGTFTGQIGATGIWEYSQGGNSWGTFNNFVDASSNLTTQGTFSFANEPDWAVANVNGTQGYAVRWRKTGGTVTQADSIDVLSVHIEIPFVNIKTFDGTATYTDVTNAASLSTSNNFEVLAAGANDNASILFFGDEIFSRININLAQLQIGGTGVWEYSLGGGSWDTLSNIYDITSNFTSQTGEINVEFNPVYGWVTDTIDGANGYIVRWRKTGGTVTQAARGDLIKGFRNASVFIRRWNNTAPTEGFFQFGTTSGAGYRLNTSTSTENVEWYRFRSIGTGTWNGAPREMKQLGCQIGLFGGGQLTGGTVDWTFAAANNGTRWWSIADHNHQDKDDPFIANIIARMTYANSHLSNSTVDSVTGNTVGVDLTNELAAAGIVTPDYNAFDDMGDWNDWTYFPSGPYGNSGTNMITRVDGAKFRNCPALINGYNDSNVIVWESNDNHTFAKYGNFEGKASLMRRVALENGNRMWDFYPQGTASNYGSYNLKPVTGSGASRANVHVIYSYFSGKSPIDESASFRGHGGLLFEADQDSGKYDDGTGDNSNCRIIFTGFKDIQGPAVASITCDQEVKILCNFFDNTNEIAHTNGGFSNNGRRSTNVLRNNSSNVYTDITDNVKAGISNSSWMFDTGVANDEIIFGCTYMPIRRMQFTVGTAGVGTPTLALYYWKSDNTWQAASNVTNLNFNSAATIDVTWDKPVDTNTTSIAGKVIYPVKIKIESGSYSTVPIFSRVATQLEGGSIWAKHNKAVNFDNGFGGIRIQHGAGTFPTNAPTIISDWNEWVLSPGQNANTIIFTENGGANRDFFSWRGRSKLYAYSDALANCVFDPQSTLTLP